MDKRYQNIRGKQTGNRMKHILAWSPQPGPQTEAITCPIPDIMFGGARGGGKSDWLLGDFVRHASKAKGKAKGILIRRTTPQLEQLIARSKVLYPLLGARWIAGSRIWLFPCNSTLKMRWLDRDADADNYQGHEYTWLGVDEAGTWSDPTPLDKLQATLRSSYGVPCETRMTANPGGLGHEWIKERYVKPAPSKIPFVANVNGALIKRVYIPSRLSDNKKLIEADPTYIDRIKASGPPWLVRAWLEGDWEASAGDNYFTEQCLLIEGKPFRPSPIMPAGYFWCDSVYAVMDTALKEEKQHDGTAIIYFATNHTQPYKLLILDWEIYKIQGALLKDNMPQINKKLEMYAEQYKARNGSKGVYVEDKGSGTILLQQMAGMKIRCTPISAAYTAMGKENRAIDVSREAYSDLVKITEYAYTKTATYNEQHRNHFLSQVCGFKINQKDGARDLLDCFCYGIQLAGLKKYLK